MAAPAKGQPKISKRRAEETVLHGVRMDGQVRDLPPVVIDEPDTRGGTNAGPSLLEYVTSGHAGCQAARTAQDLVGRALTRIQPVSRRPL